MYGAIRGFGFGTVALVLTGVVIGTLLGSAIALLKYLADPYNQLPAITFWLLGSLAATHGSDGRWWFGAGAALGSLPIDVDVTGRLVWDTYRYAGLLEGEPESPEHAQAMWSLSFTQMAGGDAEGARTSLEEARAIARRVGSPPGAEVPLRDVYAQILEQVYGKSL